MTKKQSHQEPTREFAREELIVLAHLRHRQRVHVAHLEGIAQTLGVAYQQSFALLILNGETLEYEAPIMSRLAELLVLELNSTVELVDRLQKRKLVQRERDRIDLRQVRIHLTPDGQRLAWEIARGHLRAIRETLPAVMDLGQVILAWPE